MTDLAVESADTRAELIAFAAEQLDMIRIVAGCGVGHAAAGDVEGMLYSTDRVRAYLGAMVGALVDLRALPPSPRETRARLPVRLVEAAKEKAGGGSADLAAWRARLSEAQRAALLPVDESLKAIASAADRITGRVAQPASEAA